MADLPDAGSDGDLQDLRVLGTGETRTHARARSTLMGLVAILDQIPETSMPLTRRTLLSRLLALGAGAWLRRYRAMAAPYAGMVKITAVKAMQVRNIAGNCLIRIETDSGLVGYGEAGSSGPMARARLAVMEPMLVGKDPLAMERHFHDLITLMHPYEAHIPTISGIDIALWDLAGKILDKPVNVLLGGPFRDGIKMYSHGRRNQVGDMQDMGRMREWAAEIREAPEGFTAFKISIDYALGIRAARFTTTLDPAQIRRIGVGFMNARDAVGEDIAVAVHGHNELDTTSAIQVAHAVEPMRPYFYEDPLPVQFSEGWQALRDATPIPLLVGEKLELTGEFRPFLDAGVADYIHPDLAFAGGITGTRKIADYAMLTRRPVALHNVGSLVLTYASAHFGSSIHNFFRSESQLGRPARHIEQMSAIGAPDVRNGVLTTPTRPGLGFEPDEDYLKGQLVDGEQFWD